MAGNPGTYRRRTAERSIQRELRAGEHVALDTSKLLQQDFDDLKDLLASHSMGGPGGDLLMGAPVTQAKSTCCSTNTIAGTNSREAKAASSNLDEAGQVLLEDG